MKDLLSQKRIFLMGGPGGVGKTTLAASLGIQAAKSGYKTVVLTVDPAKRLAQSLGFKDFSNDLQKVALDAGYSGELVASMLDVERYFDKVIDRFAKTKEQRDKILNNRLYRTMVESLGGSHEYAAMERLLEFAKDSRFQKLIIDTPPTQNAIDLLSAPQRLADFMDNSVLKWFHRGSPKYMKFFMQGTKLAMKFLEKIFGSDFIAALSETIEDLEGMQSGFRERNLEVLEILKSPACCFMLVTYPSEVRYLETVDFIKTLKGFGISLGGLVLNRIEPDSALSETPGIRELSEYQHALYKNQNEWISKFKALGLPVILIEKESIPAQDIAALTRLGDKLFTPT